MQDIKKMRERVLQAPVTDGMTKEQLHEFYKATHEENCGTLGPGVWDCVGSGASYKIEDKPLSDDVQYKNSAAEERAMVKQDLEVLAGRNDKSKQILKWIGFVEKLTAQIKVIEADATMSVADKQRKIAHRQEIINGYNRDIEQALDFIAKEKAKNKELYAKYQKTK